MTTVWLVALGSIHTDILEAVEQALALAYGVAVRVLPPLPEPAYAIDAQRGQFSSSLILRELIRHAPPAEERILGVTEKDLCIPMLSFVLGQAQLNGPAAVISLARLRQEFYGLPADPGLLRARAAKEAVHEVGHTFGLTHCPDPACPMSLSNTVRHVDVKGAVPCRACRSLVPEHVRDVASTNSILRRAGTSQ